MPIKFTKNGVKSSFSGSEKFFQKGWKKIQHATKDPLFSLFLQKKNIKVLGHNFLNGLWKVFKIEKKNIN